MASTRGKFSLSHSMGSFELPSNASLYFSRTTFADKFFLCSIGIVNPQPSLADPKITSPSWGSIFHFPLISFGVASSTYLFTSVMISVNRLMILSAGNFCSIISRSTLLINSDGRHHSDPTARLILVTVWVIIPSNASTKIMAPSDPRNARETSPVKLICPGVSLISNK